MALRDLLVGIGIDIDDGPLAQLDRRLDEVVHSLRNFDLRSIDRAVDDVGDLSNGFDDLENSIEGAADQLDDLDNTNLNNLDREVRNTDGSMGTLKKTIMGVGGALAALGIGTAIKDFATGSIESAASAQAMNAQFGAVFDGIEKESIDSLNKIAEETDMLPNRLKGSFTQMAAFAKTTGMDTADSLALTERATRAAADSAAFYDKSIEETADSIQSFLKGNYENDAALGISATETTRNAKANDLYGQSFKDLDEAQKQLTLLAMVEDGNKLSGALGQAARESKSYENQMGNLKQAWQDFLGKAGGPILDQAVDGLTKLSDVVSNIDPGPFMEFVSSGIEKLSVFKDILSAYYDTYTALFSGDVSGVSDIWESLGVPEGVADGIESLLQTYIDGFNYAKDVVLQFVNDVIVPLMPVAHEFTEDAFGFISKAVDGAINVFDTLKSIISGVIEDVIIPLFPVAKDVISTAFDIISPIIRIAGDLFEGITGAVKFLVQEIVVPLLPLVSAAIQGAWIIMKPILGDIKSAFDGIADAVEWVIEKLSAVGKAIKDFDIGDKISGVVSTVTSWMPGFEVGLGRVPYDDMPALLHKDEAVLPKDEADTLRDAGILKGEGTSPTLDFGSASQYNTASAVTTNNTNATVRAPVQIIVQGSENPQETAVSVRDQLEEFFGDLLIINPPVREG